ncbi:MAG: Cys-tRNA(Pro) deacylase [Sphingobium sp.]|uniref:Cys-tRNA(Pro) deacylase n=1 Tax=Sphingobium sp. TaxID=1912891 RepID=UPI0029B2A077|nr:Cys-tRNA(Pro) deacylase [Sphingobium sp.]MDX3911020.1 Cys-tRNA(Pro) deacylase [Sphingobium sp.]
MSKSQTRTPAATPATRFLSEAGISYRVAEYVFRAGTGDLAGDAAKAIGLAPERVFKTLMIEVDGDPACVVVPADRQVSMKQAAKAAGGKSAAMMDPLRAAQVTAYVKGGISPFGQRRRSPVYLDSSALGFDEIAVNGGKRGLLVLVSPEAMVKVPDIAVADLCS